MATYKVLQDIEAEDTLIGPLTLRQCLYAAIAVISAYLSFIAVAKHAPFLILFFLPFIAFGVFFAFPWSKQQPTEVWALAKVRFYFKPRKRIWNQSGVKQLVTITAPKQVRPAYASNLSPTEVKSRLKALADTIDSRGWAVKNVDLGYYKHPSVLGRAAESDRLVNISALPQDVPADAATPDIFDVQNNPLAQKFDVMMTQAAGMHRQQLMQQMAQPQPAPAYAMPAALPAQAAAAPQPAAPADYWHMRPAAPVVPVSPAAAGPVPPQYNQPPAVLPATPPAAPLQAYDPNLTLNNDETAIAQQVQGPAAAPAPDYSGIRTQAAQPSAPVPASPAPSPQTAVTAAPDPAILELANNNDLNVATIAREAQARKPEPPDEVVVSLH